MKYQVLVYIIYYPVQSRATWLQCVIVNFTDFEEWKLPTLHFHDRGEMLADTAPQEKSLLKAIKEGQKSSASV